ncbi:MAG: glycosyltransferase family 4 protein [Anaerolineae bacterium]|nr:glycosyltransferase family 4 protein [Anaerolineae bacterium]
MSQRPIKIMRIIARLNIGGPAIHVTLLTRKLSAPAYESQLVTGNIDPEEGDMSYYATQHQIEPLVVPELGRSLNPLRDIITIWKLYRLMRQEQPDIVHTHTAKAGFVGRWAAKLAGVPVILHTFHGHVFAGYFSPLKTRFFIWLEQLTARISDTIITLTQGLRRELVEDYRIARREKFTVLPLGLDLEPFARTPRKAGDFRRQWHIPADAPLVGIAGRFVPVKNHALFLAAAALVRQQRPDAHFVLIGDGELRAEVEQQIEALGLRDCITLTGWQRDLTTAYGDMDVFVISSVNEGTPVTVIEALSAGCPVVATAVGGLPDLLDGGAFGELVPSQDQTALANAILKVLANPPDTRLAQKAMLDRYGIERLVSDLDSLYRGLLARKQPR